MTICIRKEQVGDIQAIQALITAAFLKAPHTEHTEQFIVNALRDAGALEISLLAEDNAAIVGHVALSAVTLSDGTTGWYGLGPISVLPAYQGQGIGAKLMNAAIQALRDKHAKGCVLLGDPDYYQRFGFAPKAGLVLADVPPEYFQALLLEGDLPQAYVSYHEAFAAKA